ncbi:type IV pilus assembly protein PilY1 [Oryzisolibacter propanilivorax]|uniref:Type IV pilus assembly protein PilY1 n=1 Tax=Oryzisolibacter propanilivorax TaxID=1527607 RepID=A0A1G9UTS9_9BURK|nr:PilC/PilY family type IV pilus protein [Oryzisolibacter propanilivorax]SDM63334.1 type IV pilus assembly protein PilY1 [Oryzisolibacter propanilivorax]
MTNSSVPARRSVAARHMLGLRFAGLSGVVVLATTLGLRLATSQDSLPVATVDLASPPSAKQEEPSNVSLALSVEFPTVGAAYREAQYRHEPTTDPYLGYWDVKSCYAYKEGGDASSLGGEYFYRTGAASSSGDCSNAYSGNLLNYVATSAIDVLRLTLTGGNRVVDTASATVLERAYLYKDWKLNNGTYFPVRKIHKKYFGKAMPNGTAASGDDFVYAGSCKDRVWFGTKTGNDLDCDAPSSNNDLNPSKQVKGSDGKDKTVYVPMYARVKVCTPSEAPSRGDLCARYPSGQYKPIGEIQKKSDGTRLAAFGYLADNSDRRYGGVLRAPMGYVGPMVPNASGILAPNAEKEWDAVTGVFTDNPKKASSFTYSGVINYVNRFGTTGSTKGDYKGLDPVGELYYESLRYYMGLGPTPAAVQDYVGKEDGFPVYTTWVDPIRNACQRKNFTLVIGDVNTHFDKQLPGHGGSNGTSTDAQDPARGVESLLGSGTFNAADWAKVIGDLETNASQTYTNSFGVAVSTKGNPNPNGSNSGLNNKKTGSGNRSSYLWAGAAYWAHTQPIRNDNDSDVKSKSLVRVNTFTIDVDEGGNGTIDNNPRSIKPRESSFYLAGKYGWFNNADGSKVNRLQPLSNGALGVNEDLDGHPFRNVLTGALDNSRWEYAGAPNTPDGYVIASQAKKLQEGVARFFNSIGGSVTPSSVVGLSSVNFSTASPDGALFVPQFDSKTWAGRLVKAKMSFSQSTGDLAVASALWDAGKILTDASVAGSVTDPMVRPVDRKLFTYTREGANRGGQVLSKGEKSKLDAAVLVSLAVRPIGAPTGISDSGMQDATLDWLRGERALEAGVEGGYLRARTSVLGAIVNSGPVYQGSVDSDSQGDGFAQYAVAQKNRTPVVYVGANDGFLHAFRASDGKELFGYMPRAVAHKTARLASADYTYQPLVDAIPAISDAQQVDDEGQLQWRTLLVSGMGGGAQGIFALDVTDPVNFSKDKVLFEFTDQDDVDMGNVVGAPQLVRMMIPGSPATYRWFVAVGSGYNNYQPDGHANTDGAQALFLLSVDKAPSAAWVENTNYFKVRLPAPSGTTKAAALTNPGVATDLQGNAVNLYAGDTYGNLWKFDFRLGLDAAKAAVATRKSGSERPLAKLTDKNGKPQPITTIPRVAPGLMEGYMVIVGTGKYLESGDAATTEQNSVYGIWDNLGNKKADYEVKRTQLTARSADPASQETFEFGSQRGWYLDLPVDGERVVVEPDTRFGYTAVNSFVPPSDCSANGTGAMMTFDNLYGFSRSARDYRSRPLSRPRIVALDLSGADTHTYTVRQPTGRRKLTVTSRPVSAVSGAGASEPTVAQGARVSIEIPAGRVGWREIKNF